MSFCDRFNFILNINIEYAALNNSIYIGKGTPDVYNHRGTSPEIHPCQLTLRCSIYGKHCDHNVLGLGMCPKIRLGNQLKTKPTIS